MGYGTWPENQGLRHVPVYFFVDTILARARTECHLPYSWPTAEKPVLSVFTRAILGFFLMVCVYRTVYVHSYACEGFIFLFRSFIAWRCIAIGDTRVSYWGSGTIKSRSDLEKKGVKILQEVRAPVTVSSGVDNAAPPTPVAAQPSPSVDVELIYIYHVS